MLNKLSVPFLAFLQMTGLVIYVALISVFFNFVAPKLADNMLLSEFFAPIIMLVFFVISAVISATLVLGRAAVLFWEKQYKKCFHLILWNISWGFIYLTLFVSYLVILK